MYIEIRNSTSFGTWVKLKALKVNIENILKNEIIQMRIQIASDPIVYGFFIYSAGSSVMMSDGTVVV